MLPSSSQPLDFRAQADQMIQLIEAKTDAKLETHQRIVMIEVLALKFKNLFEQGVASGRKYEREGVYPYSSLTTDAF